MEDDKVYFLISMPIDFKDKFVGFLKNINILNMGMKLPLLELVGVYTKKKYVAVPIDKGGARED